MAQNISENTAENRACCHRGKDLQATRKYIINGAEQPGIPYLITQELPMLHKTDFL